MIEMRQISKSFPGVAANRDVDFVLRPGEVHALLGENGAGKSTLMNILGGTHKPDAGEIRIDGRSVSFDSPADAISAGIGMVYQHFKLVDAFSVAENLHLGWRETPRWISRSILRHRSETIAAQYGLDVSSDARIYQLSAGEQQRVEILRVLSRGIRILIFDEPTAVLTPDETRVLFETLRRLKREGYSVVFISHKLDEVLEISDRISVMRGGQMVANESAASCDHSRLAEWMVGKEILFGKYPKAVHKQRPVLTLEHISARNDRNLAALVDVDLEVRSGEILGIAGVAGNGQRELTEVVTGLRDVQVGKIEIDGVDLTNRSPAQFAAAGIGHIPEDRIKSALASALSLIDNSVLREYGSSPLSSSGWMNRRETERFARQLLATAGVTVPNPHIRVRALSGGNQQRLVTHREMRIAKRALIAANPTRGLDVQATEIVRRALVELRNRGVAVMLVSADLDEILAISDRIVVMYKGRVSSDLRAGVSRQEIGLLMGGGAADRQLH